MSSVWTQTTNRPKFPPLDGDLNTDVLIVGGGIAGLLCAHRLRQAGADCVLLEAKGVVQRSYRKHHRQDHDPARADL